MQLYAFFSIFSQFFRNNFFPGKSWELALSLSLFLKFENKLNMDGRGL